MCVDANEGSPGGALICVPICAFICLDANWGCHHPLSLLAWPFCHTRTHTHSPPLPAPLSPTPCHLSPYALDPAPLSSTNTVFYPPNSLPSTNVFRPTDSLLSCLQQIGDGIDFVSDKVEAKFAKSPKAEENAATISKGNSESKSRPPEPMPTNSSIPSTPPEPRDADCSAAGDPRLVSSVPGGDGGGSRPGGSEVTVNENSAGGRGSEGAASGMGAGGSGRGGGGSIFGGSQVPLKVRGKA